MSVVPSCVLLLFADLKLTGSDLADQPALPVGVTFCDTCEYDPKCYFLLPLAVSSPPSLLLCPPAPCWFLSAEDAFLSAVIHYTNSSTVHFKLSPAYILYATGRFALRRHGKAGRPPSGPMHTVAQITNKMVAMTGRVIQASPAGYLTDTHRLKISSARRVTLPLRLPCRGSRALPALWPSGWPTPRSC